jgi:hypothetical protein
LKGVKFFIVALADIAPITCRHVSRVVGVAVLFLKSRMDVLLSFPTQISAYISRTYLKRSYVLNCISKRIYNSYYCHIYCHHAGENIPSMQKQTALFNKTLEKYLPQQIKNAEDLSKDLSSSIFVISIGSNDYLDNYLQAQYYNTSILFDMYTFSDLLMWELEKQLKVRYFVSSVALLVKIKRGDHTETDLGFLIWRDQGINEGSNLFLIGAKPSF